MQFNEQHSPIRSQRYKQRLTQYRLARLIGRSQAYVCQMETGYRVPSPEMLRRLALVLRCRPQDLVTKEEESTVNA